MVEESSGERDASGGGLWSDDGWCGTDFVCVRVVEEPGGARSWAVMKWGVAGRGTNGGDGVGRRKEWRWRGDGDEAGGGDCGGGCCRGRVGGARRLERELRRSGVRGPGAERAG